MRRAVNYTDFGLESRPLVS